MMLFALTLLGVLVIVLTALVARLWLELRDVADEATAAHLQGMALDVKVRQLMGGST